MQSDLNFCDILLKHKKSIVDSRSQCDISVNVGNKTYSSPVCCSNMKSVITADICKMFDVRKWFYVYHRIDGVADVEDFVVKANGATMVAGYVESDDVAPWYTVSISVGVGKTWIDLVERLYSNGLRVDAFTVDVALSYNDNVIPIIKKIKQRFPTSYLIVGNGSTPEWITWLEEIGANCAKVGIGVSKACRTRQYTGFGSTTVSSLIACVESAKYMDIMSDGGITVDSSGEVWVGDVNKALAFGADFVMSGALFSRCIDSPSALFGYYGNASAHAKKSSTHIEGAKFDIKTNGRTVSQMCDLISDSIKSGISYAGGVDISAFKHVEWTVDKNSI